MNSRFFISKPWFYFFMTGLSFFGLGSSVSMAENPWTGPSVDLNHGDLTISDNQRYLIHRDGVPFFYLGDTAWELFHRLNRDEAETYLENRRQKGFTVIQAVVLAELDGLDIPNALGEKPLIDNDPTQPNEAYFQHVDFIVDTAATKGIYIGMLPTWGDKVTLAWGKGPVIFNPQNAYVYGKFLGNRYKDKPNILWILGGDRVADGVENIWREMARGIAEGDGGRHLKTYHPQGGRSSADWFQRDEWLSFNMLQSGHSEFDMPNFVKVQTDYERTPIKPCLDGEPRYEDHPVNWDPKNGWFNDFDVRQAAYWALFAGAFGHTYGCHDIWQMMAPGRQPISSARTNWYEALDFPGAWDMMHVRNLIQSRPFISRVPDPSIIAKGQSQGATHLMATRGEDYLMVYSPYGNSFHVQMGKISGKNVNGWWFDPRNGESKEIGSFENNEIREFDPPGEPSRGNDWVLILDDASKSFPKPGLIH